MGYDIHIVRTENWFASMDNPIFLEEWEQIAKTDYSLRMDGATELRLPNGMTLRYENEGLTHWISNDKKKQIPFDFMEGRITVKNPDEEIIKKMKEIANQLKAKVIGDDGEEY